MIARIPKAPLVAFRKRRIGLEIGARQVVQQDVIGLAPAERVDPDEHTIDFQELLADFVGEFFVVNRGLGMNAEP